MMPCVYEAVDFSYSREIRFERFGIQFDLAFPIEIRCMCVVVPNFRPATAEARNATPETKISG